MRKILLLVAISICSLCSFAQQSVDELVNAGLALYKTKDYAEALKRFTKALEIDKTNYDAAYHRSYSLMMTKDYEGCGKASEELIKQFPEGPNNKLAYLNWGTALDMLGKPSESITVYNKGIKMYPDFALLYFNKAITQYRQQKTADALETIELSLTNDPYHASSHQVVSVLESNNKVYSLMASAVFLAIEPASQRSALHLKNVRETLGANVKRTGENSTNITLRLPSDKDKKKDNDFSSVEMLMSMSFAMNISEEHKNETEIERLERNLSSVCAMLKPTAENKGFGWRFYAPFFFELNQQGHLKTFCHYISSSSGDATNAKWLEENKDKVASFKTWFNAYAWGK